MGKLEEANFFYGQLVKMNLVNEAMKKEYAELTRALVE